MENKFLRCFLGIFCYLISSLVISSSNDLVIVSREEWHAKPPKYIENLTIPVPYVVIHHSYMPAACYNFTECVKAMQWMQDLHQINNSWADIGYNFAVGSDGRAYEGRGWSRVGAHATSYNNKSIGICLIGDWRENLPPENQLRAVHQLIAKGVRDGIIVEDYKLVGHKQVRAGTECPGDRLFQEIATWPHFYYVPNATAQDGTKNVILNPFLEVNSKIKKEFL